MTDSSQAAVSQAQRSPSRTPAPTRSARRSPTARDVSPIPALPPATYHIKVELQGFQTAELPNFVLRQGETARPTITLGVATVSESVTVTGEAPLLQTQSASVGQVINEKQIEDLPLNGRTVLSLASLSAGVTPRNFARNTQFGRRNQFITVEGGRDSSTNYTIDGVYVRSLRFNNLSLNPPIDAVQEVSLLRNSFSTEYGQGQAVVSIVTKSGTNQMHGSAYEFYRGDRFDAKNFFAPTKPEYKRNQFGATGGGPIMRNKFFVFGAYEGLRTIQGQPFLGSVPSQAFLSGNFSALATPIRDPLTGQPFPGNIIPPNRFSKFANVLTPTIPAPNTAGANNYTVIRNFIDDANTATMRADQTLNNSHSLFQRFMYYKGSQLQPGTFNETDLPQRGRNLAVGHTWVLSSSWVNEIPLRLQLRVPPERANQSRRSQLDGRSGSAEPLGRNVSARVRTPERGDGRLLGARRRRQHAGRDREHLQRVERDQQDVRRPHAPVRSAGAVPQVRSPHRQLDARQLHVQRQFHGQFRRRLSARVLLDLRGRVRRLRRDLQLADHCAVHRRQLAGERQAEPPARIAMGIPRAVGRSRTAWKRRSTPRPARLGTTRCRRRCPPRSCRWCTSRKDYFPDGILQKDFNNFGPRVGVAYNLTDRMVRAFGVRRVLRQPESERAAVHAPDSAVLRAILAEPARHGSAAGRHALPGSQQHPAVSRAVLARSGQPHAVHDAVERERAAQPGRDYLVEAAYTGSRSRNLSKRYNINQARLRDDAISTRGCRFRSSNRRCCTQRPSERRDFKGLSLRFEKRYSAGLFFLANYQLSENRDNGSGEVEANDTAFRTDFDADESLSRYHQRHRGAFSFGYELPFGEGRRWLNSAGPVAYALGEWQVQGVIRAGSGFPFTLSGTNVCQCGSFVPQRVNYAAGREDDRGVLDNPTVSQWYDKTAYVLPAAGSQGTAGRNTLIGPGSKQVDFSLSKRFPIGATRLEFRWEIFNLFNTTNFGQPDGNINDVPAGIISTADDARNMQFGIRLAW